MDAKTSILTAIRQNKPAPRPLPPSPLHAEERLGLKSRFCENLLLAGAEWMTLEAISDWTGFLTGHYPGSTQLITTVPELARDPVRLLPPDTPPAALQAVDVAILPGLLGVAENGAIWIGEEQMGVRVLPFITQHLIIFLPEDQLVENMHVAYQRVEPEKMGFGVFIAGPSKTADIEQSLVKGAQGARTLLVVLHGS